jgi:hypothetical protein
MESTLKEQVMDQATDYADIIAHFSATLHRNGLRIDEPMHQGLVLSFAESLFKNGYTCNLLSCGEPILGRLEPFDD